MRGLSPLCARGAVAGSRRDNGIRLQQRGGGSAKRGEAVGSTAVTGDSGASPRGWSPRRPSAPSAWRNRLRAPLLALGMERGWFFFPEKLLATRPFAGAILGEKGRSRYINPSLGSFMVGADLGQVLRFQQC